MRPSSSRHACGLFEEGVDRTEAVFRNAANRSRPAGKEVFRRNQVLAAQRRHDAETRGKRKHDLPPRAEVIALHQLTHEADVRPDALGRILEAQRDKRAADGIDRVIARVPRDGARQPRDVDGNVEHGQPGRVGSVRTCDSADGEA